MLTTVYQETAPRNTKSNFNADDAYFRDWTYQERATLLQPALDDIAVGRTLPAEQVYAKIENYLSDEL